MTVTHDGHKYVIQHGALKVCDRHRGRGEERLRELMEREAAIAAGFIDYQTGDADLVAYRGQRRKRGK